MPLYDYHCRECGIIFERLRRRGTESEECPKCGEAAHRRLSTPSLPRDGAYSYRER